MSTFVNHIEEFDMIPAYKGFNRDLTCRGWQYAEGETYQTDRAELCATGFHACPMPLDTLRYYPPGTSVYHAVEVDADAHQSNDKVDEADALRTELTHMREARDNARTEVERLTATVRRVRELHRESHGSLSALYPNPICECGKDYPCPTIRALDGGADA